MNDVKSPFMIIPQFISPLMCDDIASNNTPLIDEDGLCILKPRMDLLSFIKEKIEDMMPIIAGYYDINPTDLDPPVLYKLSENVEPVATCDSSKYINSKWVQIYPRDISGYIALSNFNDKVPFDTQYEVYGGKLEFPQHQFGFNPQIGTLILYPSAPHFIHQHTIIQCGTLYYIQFFIKADVPYLYKPTNFPGDYTTWFREVS